MIPPLKGEGGERSEPGGVLAACVGACGARPHPPRFARRSLEARQPSGDIERVAIRLGSVERPIRRPRRSDLPGATALDQPEGHRDESRSIQTAVDDDARPGVAAALGDIGQDENGGHER